ncbi:MAG TPA: aspartate kinase [Bacteroidia bacterium]|nr:aspartate kinase [Bacteroidia bacterium]
MKVFKFGGASVKDAESVRNVAQVLKHYPNERIIVVVSAMGKITNALEKLVDAYLSKSNQVKTILEEIKKYHFDIIEKLFQNPSHPIYKTIHQTFEAIEKNLASTPTKDYNREYDQIVCQGEIISTLIISAYLNEVGIKNTWADARSLIRTDATYREGQVDFEFTEQLVKKCFSSLNGVVITQGFIGSSEDKSTVTLGRDGSDYSAAIFAYCTEAENVTIWKDVPGVMNADPKWFEETKLIDHMSYQDAIELSYYGATIIHPKTIKPLQNKKIPLYVKSFLHPNEPGTVINDKPSQLPIPCFIFKINQILLSISPKNFSFIVEENFSDIFLIFSENRVKINTMENSAISFSVCTDNDEKKIPKLIEKLQEKFRVLYNDNLELITIRYYDQPTIDRVCIGKKILLEHKSRYTVQLVVKNN